MKRFFLIVMGMVLSVQLLLAQNEHGLTVNVSEVKEIKGHMMIAVYDSAENFLTKKLVMGAKVAVDNEVVTHHFEGLPYGNYAISVYHDLDSDGELATNFMGIPKEPYGFSNEGVNVFGVPSFKRAVFAYNKPVQMVEIKLK